MKKKEKPIIIAAGREGETKKDIIDTIRCKNYVEKALKNKGFSVVDLYIEKCDFQNADIIKEKIKKTEPICIFNLFEGFSDDTQKEVEFVTLLENLGIPFTGNTSYPLNICLDKGKVKELLKANNIATPQGMWVDSINVQELKLLNFPIFVKPRFEDASVGIDKCSLIFDMENLYKILDKKLAEFSKGLILEEFISGKEYSAGFLGDLPYELLSISVIDYARYKDYSPYLTYASKWDLRSEEYKKIIPSLEDKISDELKERIENVSRKVGEIFKCRSYFRVDLREKDGEIFVLDVNPNPDINMDSGFMKQAYRKGYLYEDVIEKILLMADGFNGNFCNV